MMSFKRKYMHICLGKQRESESFKNQMATQVQLILTFFILISFASVALCDDEDCVYAVYVRTGSIWKGGTDSIISLTLYDSNGSGIKIKNLQAWGGLMESGHNYFERGNLDIFSGRGPCLPSPVCAMNLTSDGSGDHHGWYCNYVEVTMTGVHTPCSQQQFEVEQWLARDAPPYELSAIRNYCKSASGLPIDRSQPLKASSNI